MGKHKITNRRLVRLLMGLTPSQQMQFREYLSCSLFNTNQTIVKVYDCLLEDVIEAETKPKEVHELRILLGLGASTLEKYFSQLNRHFRDFTVRVLWEKGEMEQNVDLFQAWVDLKFEPALLEMEYKRMVQRMDRRPVSQDLLLARFQLERIYRGQRINNPRNTDQLGFSEELGLLESFFQTAWSRYLCAQTNAVMLFAEAPSQEGATEDVLIPARANMLREIYNRLLQLMRLKSPDLGAFQEVLALLRKWENEIAMSELLDMMGYLLNASFQWINRGGEAFLELIAAIYELMRERKLLTISGEISPGHFKNTVSILLRLSKTEEAMQFVEAYESYLPAAVRSAWRGYCLGLIAFYQQRFRDAVDHFTYVIHLNSRDIFLPLESRNMLWKSYFELLDDLSPLELKAMMAHYHAFRVFLRRESGLSQEQQELYLNFIRFFNRLVNLVEQSPVIDFRSKLLTLEEEVQQTNGIANKAWLLNAIRKRIDLLPDSEG